MGTVRRKPSDITWHAADVTPSEPTKGFGAIFAISSSEAGPTLLGVTADPRKRIYELQLGNPKPLLVRRLWWAQRIFADLVLGDCRRLLARTSKTLVAGWCDLPLSAVSDVVGFAARNVGVELLSDRDMLRACEEHHRAVQEEARSYAQRVASPGRIIA